jgi:hypothetical protein
MVVKKEKEKNPRLLPETFEQKTSNQAKSKK